MISWILQLLAQAGNTVAGVANAATARILAVWNNILTFFLRVKGAVVGARAAILAWLGAHIGLAISTITTLKWLITTFVPNQIRALQSTLITWAARQIAATLATERALVAQLQAWALTQLVALAKGINALQSWAVTQFASAVARLTRIESYLFGALATPERIAAYIVDAMARALGRWALNNAVRVGRLGWRLLLSSVVSVAGVAEDIITRII